MNTMTKDYNKYSLLQNYTYKKAYDLIPQIFGKFLKPRIFDKEPFSIADYGCAGGSNSLFMIKIIINLVRTENPNKEIHIYLNDLEQNDFSLPIEIFNQQYKDDKNILIFFSGKTFYEQVFSNNTIDFGFSGNSVHWRNEMYSTSQTVFPFMNQSEEVKAKWREGASKELEKFLFHRRNELKEGGIMIIVSPYFYEKDYKLDEKISNSFVSQSIKQKLVEFINTKNFEKSNLDKLLVKMFYVEPDDAVKILEKLNIQQILVENQLIKLLDFFSNQFKDKKDRYQHILYFFRAWFSNSLKQAFINSYRNEISEETLIEAYDNAWKELDLLVDENKFDELFEAFKEVYYLYIAFNK